MQLWAKLWAQLWPPGDHCVPAVRRLAQNRRSTGEEDSPSDSHTYKVHVASVNNFPTAAGLASSAAGYACLGAFLGSLVCVDVPFLFLSSFVPVPWGTLFPFVDLEDGPSVCPCFSAPAQSTDSRHSNRIVEPGRDGPCQ